MENQVSKFGLNDVLLRQLEICDDLEFTKEEKAAYMLGFQRALLSIGYGDECVTVTDPLKLEN